jgi:hypothetical protein
MREVGVKKERNMNNQYVFEKAGVLKNFTLSKLLAGKR